MKNKNASRTIIDVIESWLGSHLTEKYLSRLQLSPKSLAELGQLLNEHYDTYELPIKPESELRPFISTQFTTSGSMGLNYVFGERHFDKTHTYQFDASSQGEMTQSIKKVLLYSHGVVIQDPLPYLLDYFTDGLDNEISRSRVPAVQSLLQEYADLAELVRQQIVIPILEPVLDGMNIPRVQPDHITELKGRLPDLGIDAQILANEILEVEHRRNRLGDRVDPFFPHRDFVRVLRELLLLSEKQFDSRDLLEPFGLTVVGGVTAIDPSAVSTKELVRIRTKDELFADWRVFLGRIFQDLQMRESWYSDIDQEYVIALREEFTSWRERFAVHFKRSSMKTVWSDAGMRVSIGIVSGGVSGALIGGAAGGELGGIVGGAAGSLVQPFIELLRDVFRVHIRRPDAAMLRHHFLALGVLEDEA